MTVAAGRHRAPEVTEERPLIVLDLGCGEFAAKMMIETLGAAQSLVNASYFDRDKITYRLAHLQLLIDQITEQTRPPRIPEPGWGEKVTASVKDAPERRRWVAVKDGRSQWWHSECGHRYAWDELIDPTEVPS